MIIKTINPDDLTPELHAIGLISPADKTNIDNTQYNFMQRNKFLLTAVVQAIMIDSMEQFLLQRTKKRLTRLPASSCISHKVMDSIFNKQLVN